MGQVRFAALLPVADNADASRLLVVDCQSYCVVLCFVQFLAREQPIGSTAVVV